MTALALGAPSVAWFYSGRNDAEVRAERARAELVQRATDAARGQAAQIGRRLEALRRSESRRSYTDYAVVEGRDGICELPLDSPLADGPADPLVWAHFQLDEVGELSLPTLFGGGGTNEDPRLAEEARRVQRAILGQLECATPRAPAGEHPRTVLVQDAGEGHVVTVEPLQWQALDLDGEPALAAARTVTRPDAVLTQGFVVRASDLDGLLADAPLPARVRAGTPAEVGEARIPLEDAALTVRVESGELLARAVAEGTRIRSRFRRGFGIGLAGIVLGGALIVALVHHAERLARQRATFAAGAAHELRTPLAGLQLYGEMLAGGAIDGDRARAYAGKIAGEAERLGRVVRNLLGASKLERGELRANAIPGDLSRATQEIVAKLRPGVEARGGRIDLDAAPGVRAAFDPDALHQILQNLVDNAVRHGNGDREPIVIEVRDGAVVTVKDRGPGVDPQLGRRLFRPYVGRGRAGGGLGLGLALVDGLARAQGARAGYESEGDGARFWVRFREA